MISAAYRWAVTNNKKLLIFSLVFFASFLHTVITCVFAKSLALIAFTFFTGYNCFIYLLRCFGTGLANRKPKDPIAFSFGLKRIEPLLEYASAALLTFSTVSISLESIHGFFHSDSVDSAWFATIAFTQLILTVIGIVKFYEPRPGLRKPKWKVILEDCSPALLILLEDLLFQLVPIWCKDKEEAFALCETEHHQTVLDTLTALAVTIVCARKGIRCCKASSSILLQTAPTASLPLLQDKVQQVPLVEGALEVEDYKFWTLTYGEQVGELKVRVKKKADTQSVVQNVHKMFDEVLSHVTVQIEQQDWDIEGDMQKAANATSHHSQKSHNHGHSHSHGHGHTHSLTTHTTSPHYATHQVAPPPISVPSTMPMSGSGEFSSVSSPAQLSGGYSPHSSTPFEHPQAVPSLTSPASLHPPT